MTRLTFIVFIGLALNAFQSCDDAPQGKSAADKLLQFSLLDSSQTGVTFVNPVKDQKDFNVFTYRNFYNGGGVAVGDINNDGLADIYFTANMTANRLYLNKGNFRFEDITTRAGVAGTRSWSTGVTMADVNADGLLDIYVCNSGDVKGDNRENELFINNGDLTFTERAAEFGLDDRGFSTHASFFDYDLDGDLDCYLLNNSFKSIDRVEQFLVKREVRDTLGGDKLLMNDGARFVDVSEKAGIYGGWIGFGLGVSVSDLNEDMLPDLYVSNDFWERDYLYVNKGDGTFNEDIIKRTSAISASSMGSDIADLNNDGFADIFTTEMLPADNFRLKTMAKFEETNIRELKVRSSYHYQFMQNCLQFNEGNAYFQETASLSNVSATDWSWGSLMFDFNNDGWKDIFVSNGIYRDITSMDFSDFVADRDNIKKIVLETGKFDFEDLLALVPSKPLSNYGFINETGKVFRNASDSLGLSQPSFSNGSAYADLDNDGDMDLVVNNVNSAAFVYRNNTESISNNHYLKIRLKGPRKNAYGIGAKVKVFTRDGMQTLQNFMTRGFQSSVESSLVFGLGDNQKVDSLVVIWPDLKVEKMSDVTADQVLTINYLSAKETFKPKQNREPALFIDESRRLVDKPRHKENFYNDFDYERLAPRAHSTEGPRLVVGDIDGNSREDFLLLGAAGSPDRFFLQSATGDFKEKQQPGLLKDSIYESTCGVLIDVDGDKDLDAIIGSGGNEKDRPVALRVYENNGRGDFKARPSSTSLPQGHFSVIADHDFDGDGKRDLFIGGRISPVNYGVSPRSYLLRNTGSDWQDITPESLKQPGMVSCAVWSDVDADGKTDLVIAGEWMPLIIYRNIGAGLGEGSALPGSAGWWTSLAAFDLDSDGREDLIAGNWGLNSKFKASQQKPLKMYVSDFDQNGKTEPVITWYPPAESKPYPFATKMDLTAQMPSLKKQNLKYGEYAAKSYDQLFSDVQRKDAKEFRVEELQTSVFWNRRGGFTLEPLPVEAQVSPVFSIVVRDLNADSHPDIFLGGNFYNLKPEVGRQDSNHGVVLLSVGNSFTAVPATRTGIRLQGEVRDMKVIRAGDDDLILIGFNSLPLKLLKTNSPAKL